MNTQVDDMKEIRIGNKYIGPAHPVFVIAEAGSNHNGSLAMAKNMVLAAKEAGADCIKFQTYTAEEFCADKQQLITYCSQGKKVTEPQYDLFKRLEFTPEQWQDLKSFCESQGLLFLTTVQNMSDLRIMQGLGLAGIKVGSDDFDHLVNLCQFADTGLPLILSKGMADLGEVDRVIRALRPHTDKLIILHCVSQYPADPEQLNLRQLVTLQHLYPDIIWGFSDHTEGTLAAAIAVALGARLIEKHFTLDHNLPGPDHWFSLDVDELTELVRDIRCAERTLGTGDVVPSPAELETKKLMRRRLVAKQALHEGQLLTEATVDFKRNSSGLFASQWEFVCGKRLARAKPKDEGIELQDIDFAGFDQST
jgi:N-acetylneuraminate synthase/N,N'-diacetyllegionaminate synthase